MDRVPDPRLDDRFEHQIDAYDEGATSLKIKLPMGEIDFIISMSLLNPEPIASKDCLFPLEPVSEVLAKKLFYRGWALTPRDLFDWWCIERLLPQELAHTQRIAKLVAARIDTISAALKQMRTSGNASAQWHNIRTSSLPDLQTSISWAQQRLVDFQELSAPPVRGTPS